MTRAKRGRVTASVTPKRAERERATELKVRAFRLDGRAYDYSQPVSNRGACFVCGNVLVAGQDVCKIYLRFQVETNAVWAYPDVNAWYKQRDEGDTRCFRPELRQARVHRACLAHLRKEQWEPLVHDERLPNADRSRLMEPGELPQAPEVAAWEAERATRRIQERAALELAALRRLAPPAAAWLAAHPGCTADEFYSAMPGKNRTKTLLLRALVQHGYLEKRVDRSGHVAHRYRLLVLPGGVEPAKLLKP